MPFIPEEQIDRVLEELVDLRESVRIQTRAVGHLNDVLLVHGQYLAKINAVVSKKPEGDTLGDLLRTLIRVDEQHTEMLHQILAAVQRPR